MAKVRLIAEAAFQADLREAVVGVLNQQFGPGNALGADLVLWRVTGAAFESPGKVAARQCTGVGQIGDFKAIAEAFEDELFHQPFTLRAEAAGAGFARFAGRGEGDGLL